MAGTGDRFWPIITIVFLVVDVALFSLFGHGGYIIQKFLWF